MKLIVNADDFGYSRGVNYGIVDAYQYGVVSSATLMVNMPGVEHAVQLSKDNPGLGVGIHFVLTCGRPVHAHVPSLIDEDGYFHRRNVLGKHANVEDIERELSAQLEKFYSFGLAPTHIDSHHHVHSHEKVLPIVLELAERYSLPLRKIALESTPYGNIFSTSTFLYQFYGDHISVDSFIEGLDDVRDHATVEMMCHPAYVDDSLLKGSSYVHQRSKELSILMNARVRDAIDERNIELISYKQLMSE